MKDSIRKAKACRRCKAPFFPFRSTDVFCSYTCAKEYSQGRKEQGKPRPRKTIKRISEKHRARLRLYSKDRQEFLSLPSNSTCFIPGCQKKATTIEHTKGREGYADQWARLNGIWLLNDIRYWKPCCLKHNRQLENDPELSRQHQVSKLHEGGRGT